MSPDLAQRILAGVRARRGEMVAFLRALVQAESPSTEPERQRPVFDLIAGELEALGFRVRRFPGRTSGGVLYARPRDRTRGRPVQLLLGHGDTVWPAGTLRRMPVRVENGCMRGPGVYDMKGGLSQIVYALRVLDDLDLDTPVAPVVLVNSDEEIGSRESTPLIRRLARIADRAYVLEPSLGRAGALKTARKGGGRFTVVVHGKAAHAGLDPGAGASAIVELAEVVRRLHDLNDPERGISVNVGQIEGGTRPNVVASLGRGVVDVRVPTQADAERIERAILGLEPRTPGVTLAVEGRITRVPMERTPRNRRLWEAARALGDALGLSLEEAMAGGASDGNTTSLYTATLDGLGATGDGAHARHEFADLERMVERTALLALLIRMPPLDRGPA